MKFSAIYREWKDKYNWNTCKLDRKEYGRFISDYLTSSTSLVANLDAPWGTGKTEFLKRLYVDISEKKHPVIYIDAWESDFSQNPLSVVSSEIVEQISLFEGKRISQALEKLKTFLNKSLKLSVPLSKAYSAFSGDSELYGLLGSIEAASKSAGDFNYKSIEQTNTQLLDRLKDAHFGQISAMKEIKKQLEFIAHLLQLVHKRELPVIVLIDELDRCRPTYSVELLEVVKHFFEIKGFVFVFASDTKQLRSSIKTIYGDDFESGVYLKRFFERTIRLPAPSIGSYVKSKNIDFCHRESNVTLHPFYDDEDLSVGFYGYLLESIQKYRYPDISLRDIDQVLAKYQAIVFYLLRQEGCIHIDLICLIISLIDEQMDNEYWIDQNTAYFDLELSYLGINVNDLIVHHRALIIETESRTIKHVSGNRQQTSPTESPCLLAEKETKRVRNEYTSVSIIKTSEKMVSGYRDNSVKYFLWQDMKRLIELSGSIE